MLRRQALCLHRSLAKWFRADIPKHALQLRPLAAPGNAVGFSSFSSQPKAGLSRNQQARFNPRSKDKNAKVKATVEGTRMGERKGKWRGRVSMGRREDAKTAEERNKNERGHETPLKYLKHRETMKKDFPDGWNPPRKISREAMDGLRALHQHNPQTFTTSVLAERFKVSPEAVRRILRSKWTPDRQEKAKLLVRERRRKQEHVEKRIGRERKDALERLMELKEKKKMEERGEFTFR